MVRLGVRTRFHVHADEAVQRGGAPNELLHVSAALVIGEIEAELVSLSETLP